MEKSLIASEQMILAIQRMRSGVKDEETTEHDSKCSGTCPPTGRDPACPVMPLDDVKDLLRQLEALLSLSQEARRLVLSMFVKGVAEWRELF